MKSETESLFWSLGAVLVVVIAANAFLELFIQLIPFFINAALLYAVSIRMKALWHLHSDKYLLALIPGLLLSQYAPLYTVVSVLLFSALLTELWIRVPRQLSRGSLLSKEFSQS